MLFDYVCFRHVHVDVKDLESKKKKSLHQQNL